MATHPKRPVDLTLEAPPIQVRVTFDFSPELKAFLTDVQLRAGRQAKARALARKKAQVIRTPNR